MIRNMGSFDRGVRAFVVAPVAIVLVVVAALTTWGHGEEVGSEPRVGHSSR